MAVFDNALNLLQEFGFFQVILPFLLIFAVIYGILIKTGIFGDDNKAMAINGIIGFATAFYVINYTPVIESLSTLLPQAAYLLVVMMLLLMALAFFMGDKAKLTEVFDNKWLGGLLVLVLVIIFLGIVDASTGLQIPVIHSINNMFIGQAGISAGAGLSQETINTIVAILLIVGIPLTVIGIVAVASKT